MKTAAIKAAPKAALPTAVVQPKLDMNTPGDRYEQEADAMAEWIMRSPGARRAERRTGGRPAPTTAISSGFAARLNQGGGVGLPATTRHFMENAFSADFSKVRIHATDRATDLTREIQAKAFTHGNDIYFAPGRYAPEQAEGKLLLAHELTHVVQQNPGCQIQQNAKTDQLATIPPISAGKQGIIQRDADDPIETDLQNGFFLQQWPLQGQALVWYRSHRWCFFEWTGGLENRLLTVSLQTEADLNRLTLHASASFHVQARIGQEAEQFISDFNGMPLTIRYNFQFPGTVGIQSLLSATSHPTPIQITTRHEPRSRVLTNEQGHRLVDLSNVPGIERGIEGEMPTQFSHPREAPRRPRSRVWSFGSQDAFNQFAASHPSTNWACIVMPDGQFVAYALTRETLRRWATNIRNGSYRADFLSEFSGRVSTVFLNGRQLASLEDLSNLYFSSEEDAWLGAGASRGMGGDTLFEGVIFQMPGNLFGRRETTHAEALNWWARIGVQEEVDVFATEVEPGYTFHELVVMGRSRHHTIDRSYFQARDSFRRTTQLRAADPFLSSVLSSEFNNYILIEADRPTSHLNVAFAEALRHDDTAATLVQDAVFRRVSDDAQQYAIRSLQSAHEGVNRLATNHEAMVAFVVNFNTLDTEHQTEALTYIGLNRHPTGTLPFMVAFYENQRYDQILSTLDNPLDAVLVALDLDELLTIESLQAEAGRSANGLSQALNQFQQGSIRAIDLEGPVGEAARADAYRRANFTRLLPARYPHRDDVSDYFPRPMAGDSRQYGSVAEQLFANYVARRSQTEQLIAIGTVVGIAAVTVGLALVSGGIGGGVAGLFFAEGSAAFIATELVVSGVAFTAGNEAFAQMQGRGDIDLNDLSGSAARLGTHAAINIATFGLFRGATSVFGALGTRVAGGAAAVEASTARAALAGGIRIGGVFSTAYLHQIIATTMAQGALPNRQQLWHLFLENVLTMAMLEAGSHMARPLMQDVGLWARGRRLGAERARQIDGLRTETQQFLEILSRMPAERAQQQAAELLRTQQKLLERRQVLADELRRELPRSGDAEGVAREFAQEHQLTQDALTLLEQAESMRQTGLRPLSDEGGNVFLYRSGTEARVRSMFGESNVTGPDSQGVIRVRAGSQELILRAEGTETTPARPTVATGVRGTAASEAFVLAGTNQVTSSGEILRQLTTGLRTGGGRAVIDELAVRPPTEAVPNAATRQALSSRFSYTVGEQFMRLHVPSMATGTGRVIEVQVRIRARGYDFRGNPNPNDVPTTPIDRVSYHLGYNQETQVWEAEMTVEPRLRPDDLRLGIGHEIDEIADVVRRVEPLTQRQQVQPGETTLEQAIDQQVRPTVFRRGSQERATSLTSHDRATGQQLRTIFDRLQQTRERLQNPPEGERAALETRSTELTTELVRMLDVMGLDGRSTATRWGEFRRGLELAGQSDPVFLEEVEAQYQQRSHQQRATARGPGGRSIFTVDIIKHLLFPGRSGDFIDSGISGGHQTTNLEALNTTSESPYFVVREGTIRLPSGDYAHRYHQYEAIVGNKQTTVRLPTTTPGGPTAQPTAGTQYDATIWRVSDRPKSAIGDVQTFMTHAEAAFNHYFETSIRGTAAANGRMFDFVNEGVRYGGYYNYNPATDEVSINSIFVHAESIP